MAHVASYKVRVCVWLLPIDHSNFSKDSTSHNEANKLIVFLGVTIDLVESFLCDQIRMHAALYAMLILANLSTWKCQYPPLKLLKHKK